MQSLQEKSVETRCPYCNEGAHLKLRGQDINRRVSEKEFELYLCDGCGLLFIANPPDDLALYYPVEYHDVPRNVDDLDRRLKRQRFKIDILTRFVDGGKLLEIGPSYGVFCRLAQVAGFEVSAIEMDERCVSFLKEHLGVRAVTSADPASVLAASDELYDAICLWHSIEHLPRPWTVLAEAARRLKPNGVLLVATPNPDAWQARVLGSRWTHHDMPRHLFALSISWLRKFGEHHDLKTEFITTRDEGSLGYNRFTWAMQFQSILGYKVLRGLPWRAGMLLGKLLEPWEGREGRGATYTAILRRV